jgi:hypothetical protein
MRLDALTLAASLFVGSLATPALARPTAATTCSDAARAVSTTPPTRSVKALRWAPRAAPAAIRQLDLRDLRAARVAAQVERAIRDYERAIGRADRLNLGSRRQLSTLRRDVLFLRGLLQGLRRDGVLDARDVAMLEAATADLAHRIEALGARGLGASTRLVRTR